MKFFAPCPPGVEQHLESELVKLGAGDIEIAHRGVHFQSDMPTFYKIALGLRTASRLLLQVQSGPANSEDELYRLASEVPWENHIAVDAKIVCRVTGVPKDSDPRYAVLRFKDAVADRFMSRFQQRPDIDKRDPDMRLEARWDGQFASIFINLSGPLHERGYRLEGATASIRETSATAVLSICDWPQIAAENGAFVDPVCGSGTFLAEAAMMAVDAPPGVFRKSWGFSAWKMHDEEIWVDLLNQSRVEFHTKIEKLPLLVGFDRDSWVLQAARNNLRRAGLGHRIGLYVHDIKNGRPDKWPAIDKGLVCANPPWGVRIDQEPEPVYSAIGDVFRTLEPDWKLAILALNRQVAAQTFLRADQYTKVFSGGIELVLGVYSRVASRKKEKEKKPLKTQKSVDTIAEIDITESPLYNTLKRQLESLQTWAEKTHVTSFRIWDCNLPEFRVAIDWYEGKWLHVQCLAELSKGNIDLLLKVLKILTHTPDTHIYVKNFDHQGQISSKGKLIMREDGARFFIHPGGRMGAGIFLKHREIRGLIKNEIARGRFLNVFSHTGTATVVAGLGGAESTVNVDIASSFHHWCQDNIKLNQLDMNRHSFEKADAIEWLEKSQDMFDLIFMDAPNYLKGSKGESNDMEGRHVRLIDLAMKRLTPGGSLLFAVNQRSFKLDMNLRKKYHIENISDQLCPCDFMVVGSRFGCWRILLHSNRI